MGSRNQWVQATLLAVWLLSSCTLNTATNTGLSGDKQPPAAMREFRAAWVATVANINWPSKAGLSTAEQQREALTLLDFLHKHNFNAVIFQIRPQADALYASELEPWSHYLTGQTGKAPSPFYDPLAFWVEEAHKRGMELHVWLNPYRAHITASGEPTPASLVKKMPDSVVKLKNGYWWFDPSKQSTQDHSAAVVMDIVKRYDIDGVHFDDYFYPYESYNDGEDFPDHASWADYQQKGGTLTRGDWRRAHVNKFVKRIYTEIKQEKKHVKFGLSPFGIWRPGYPQGITGMDQYDKLYADAKLWLNNGWVDYFTPQLYWPIAKIPQSFPLLLGWWQQENSRNRHLWPGLNAGLAANKADQSEITNQIMITRAMLPDSKGAVHWSVSALTKNPQLAEQLLAGPYKQPALVPATPWLGADKPEAPAVTLELKQQQDKVEISWKTSSRDEVFKWVLYYRVGQLWDHMILAGNTRQMTLPAYAPDGKTRLTDVIVTAVDRLGNESDKQGLTVQITSE